MIHSNVAMIGVRSSQRFGMIAVSRVRREPNGSGFQWGRLPIGHRVEALPALHTVNGVTFLVGLHRESPTKPARRASRATTLSLPPRP
jgi:hypothetical protein